DKIYKVVLSNGETLDCNILIIAIGVTPNVHLAKQAGLNVNRGIVVNEFLQTSNDCVYAAGDCIESYDFFSNTKTIFALWTSASNQGEIAGLNMAINNNNNYNSSRLLCYDFAMNAISFFGMKLISAGMICNKLKYNNVQNINIESEWNKLFKLSICNNNLVGFTMINSIRRAGIYTDLIKNKVPLSTLLYDITTKDIGLNVYPKIARMKLLYYKHH
ncbi:MAG: FAD-dependent oxidoreductase, partial [Endomicrobium sp.]|nr:FAD-dependent oxidoreductase [Endomicrobium sp.]